MNLFNHCISLSSRQVLLLILSVWWCDTSHAFARYDLPRISVNDIMKPAYQRFLDGTTAFILTDAADRWSALTKWDLSFFTSKFGSEIVDFYPNNLRNKGNSPFLVPFEKAWSEMKYSGKPQYLHWRMRHEVWRKVFQDATPFHSLQVRNRMWMKGCLNRKAMNNFYRATPWYMLTVGTLNASMFFHSDGISTASWQTLVTGSKKWIVCDPSQQHLLYSAGDVDAFDPDLERFPLFAHARCAEFLLKTGETLFYPSQWWHQALNLEMPTIGFVGRVVTPYNYKNVEQSVRGMCNTNKPDISLQFFGAAENMHPPTCSLMEKCYAWWSDRWGGKYNRTWEYE